MGHLNMHNITSGIKEMEITGYDLENLKDLFFQGYESLGSHSIAAERLAEKITTAEAVGNLTIYRALIWTLDTLTVILEKLGRR